MWSKHFLCCTQFSNRLFPMFYSFQMDCFPCCTVFKWTVTVSHVLQFSNGLFSMLYTVFKWTVSHVQTPMQKLVRRMTRFFSKQSRFEVMRELDRVFSLLGYSWKRSSSHVVRNVRLNSFSRQVHAVSHACRHMYSIRCLEENASLRWVESTARHMWWDTSD